VDTWFIRHALQNQDKHLSVTYVVVAPDSAVAGYYTIATGQIDFSALPPELSKKLPKRTVPVAVLAWLGVDARFQGPGLGGRLLAQALTDCHRASHTFPFVAVILDCVDDKAKSVYQHWDFAALPGHPMRLYLPAQALDALMSR